MRHHLRARPLLFLVPVTVAWLCGVRGGWAADPPQPPKRSVAVATSLVTPFFGAYYLEAELRASSNFGVALNTSYMTLEQGDWRARTGTVGAGARYYLQGDAPRGWHLDAIGELLFSSWRHEASSRNAPIVVGYSGIVLGGYRFLCKRGGLLDLGVGVVVLRFPGTTFEQATLDSFTKVYPAARVNIGWAF